jgi:hypothetical protein
MPKKNATTITFTKSGPAYLGVRRRAKDAYGQTASAVAARDLERYYATLRRARHLIREQFSENELFLICDSLNGTWLEPAEAIFWLRHNVADSIALNGFAVKWSVDGPALLAKLDAAAPCTLAALSDMAETFWRPANQFATPALTLDYLDGKE